jgi:hypothetical protein
MMKLSLFPTIGFREPYRLAQANVTLPPWITDLPVEAEGAEMIRYGK